MSGSTLAVLSSLDFPQVLAWAIDRTVTRTLTLLPYRSYENPQTRYGACDSVPCIAKTVVHHLAYERDLCAEQFREVSRG